MNRTGRLRRGVVITAVVTVGVAAACTSSGDEADGAEAGSTSASIADPESTTSSSETPTDSLAIATDAEDGLLFDVGVISEVVETTTATMSIRFDRYQFGGLSGPELDGEPRYEAATDVGFTNENQRLRTYLLAPEVEVLELEPDSFVEACAAPSGEVAFVESTLDSLMSHDFNLVSLSFNDDGEVVRIRDQRGC